MVPMSHDFNCVSVSSFSLLTCPRERREAEGAFSSVLFFDDSIGGWLIENVAPLIF